MSPVHPLAPDSDLPPLRNASVYPSNATITIQTEAEPPAKAPVSPAGSAPRSDNQTNTATPDKVLGGSVAAVYPAGSAMRSDNQTNPATPGEEQDRSAASVSPAGSAPHSDNQMNTAATDTEDGFEEKTDLDPAPSFPPNSYARIVKETSSITGESVQVIDEDWGGRVKVSNSL